MVVIDDKTTDCIQELDKFYRNRFGAVIRKRGGLILVDMSTSLSIYTISEIQFIDVLSAILVLVMIAEKKACGEKLGRV